MMVGKEGVGAMTKKMKKNPHLGSTLDGFLNEEGLLEKVAQRL